MTLDDIILKALEDGPITVKNIAERVERRVRVRLDKLRVRGVVVGEGRGGAHREFTYRLVRPDLAAKALGEKGGGLARAANVTAESGGA
jgi:predicted ArsR family transcriptional regulator